MIEEVSTVYVAAAIDHTTSDSDPFVTVAEKLAPLQCFNPKAAFAGAVDRSHSQIQEFIASINFHAIKKCDVLVAYTDFKACSFGMPMELFYAVSIGKPVILATNDISKAGVYASLFSDFVVAIDRLDVRLVEELVDRFYAGDDEFDKQKNRKVILGELFGGNYNG